MLLSIVLYITTWGMHFSFLSVSTHYTSDRMIYVKLFVVFTADLFIEWCHCVHMGFYSCSLHVRCVFRIEAFTEWTPQQVGVRVPSIGSTSFISDAFLAGLHVLYRHTWKMNAIIFPAYMYIVSALHMYWLMSNFYGTSTELPSGLVLLLMSDPKGPLSLNVQSAAIAFANGQL